MKKYLLLSTIFTMSFTISYPVHALDCNTSQPSCADLGYSCSECAGSSSPLKCPFNSASLFCPEGCKGATPTPTPTPDPNAVSNEFSVGGNIWITGLGAGPFCGYTYYRYAQENCNVKYYISTEGYDLNVFIRDSNKNLVAWDDGKGYQNKLLTIGASDMYLEPDQNYENMAGIENKKISLVPGKQYSFCYVSKVKSSESSRMCVTKSVKMGGQTMTGTVTTDTGFDFGKDSQISCFNFTATEKAHSVWMELSCEGECYDISGASDCW